MESFRITLQNSTRSELEEMRRQAESRGDIRGVRRITAIFALAEEISPGAVASVLGVIGKTVRQWPNIFLLKGPAGLRPLKSPGRKPKLTKSQRGKLEKTIIGGPAKAGFPGAFWRSPMTQALIYERFGVFYAVNHISQLLKIWDFLFRKPHFSPPGGTP